LTRTVKVIDTGNLGGRWTASDDAPWLQLTPSSDGSSVTLTADDTGLADDIHYATVTIAPDAEPGFGNTTQIKVGLYVDHTSPAPPVTIVSPNILDAGATVADPIRPYVYVAQTIYDGTSNGFNGAISTYNYYTGQLVEKLDFPHRMMTDLEVSPDGGLLLAADVGGNGDSSDRYINPIELSGSSRIVRPRWGGIRLDASSQFKIAEIGGAPVVLTGEKQIVSITDGAVLGDFESDAVGGYVVTGKIAVSPDGGSAIVMGTSIVNHLLARYRLTHLNGTFRALETQNINESGNGKDVASDPVGNRFITLSSNSSDSVRAYDVTTLELTKSANTHFGFTGNLDVAANSDIYVTDGLGTFSQYDSNFLQRGARTIGTQSESTFGGRLSGDGQRAVVGTVSTSVGGIAHLNFFDSQLPP
jgi:hypothetical protein